MKDTVLIPILLILISPARAGELPDPRCEHRMEMSEFHSKGYAPFLELSDLRRKHLPHSNFDPSKFILPHQYDATKQIIDLQKKFTTLVTALSPIHDEALQSLTDIALNPKERVQDQELALILTRELSTQKKTPDLIADRLVDELRSEISARSTLHKMQPESGVSFANQLDIGKRRIMLMFDAATIAGQLEIRHATLFFEMLQTSASTYSEMLRKKERLKIDFWEKIETRLKDHLIATTLHHDNRDQTLITDGWTAYLGQQIELFGIRAELWRSIVSFLRTRGVKNAIGIIEELHDMVATHNQSALIESPNGLSDSHLSAYTDLLTEIELYFHDVHPKDPSTPAKKIISIIEECTGGCFNDLAHYWFRASIEAIQKSDIVLDEDHEALTQLERSLEEEIRGTPAKETAKHDMLSVTLKQVKNTQDALKERTKK